MQVLMLMFGVSLHFFECFRYAYLGVGSFDWMDLLKSTVIIILFFASGVLIFNKVEKSFMDTV
jgi:lipopolysaccharide transport system permease protein